MNVFGAKKAVAVAGLASVVLLRRKDLGNNCGFISDAWKDLTNSVMSIVQPLDIKEMNAPEWVIRWGTTTTIPGKSKVLNKASAIKQTSDKASFRKLCADKGLAPKYWGSLEELQNYNGDLEAVIVRPLHHERSEGVHLCRTPVELKAAIAKCKEGYYISEYIPKDREIRVFVVSGRVVMAFEKHPKDKKAASWGCVEEGSLTNILWSQWPLEAMRVAIESFNLSTLDFGAVDVIMKGDKAYTLEINTAPEVWHYYGQRLAEAFHYIIKNDNRNRIPVKKYDDWKKVAHPSLSDLVVL